MVNYQGDLYIEQDGARYDVTNYPQQVDLLGVLQAGATHLEVPHFEPKSQTARASVPMSKQAGTSSKPTGPGMFHQSSLDNLFDEFNLDEEEIGSFQFWGWKSIREIKVTKVFQDDVLQEVFKKTLQMSIMLRLSYHTLPF